MLLVESEVKPELYEEAKEEEVKVVICGGGTPELRLYQESNSLSRE